MNASVTSNPSGFYGPKLVFFRTILQVNIYIHRWLRVLNLDRNSLHLSWKNLARFLSTIMCNQVTDLSKNSFARGHYNIGLFENACLRNTFHQKLRRPQWAMLLFGLLISLSLLEQSYGHYSLPKLYWVFEYLLQ